MKLRSLVLIVALGLIVPMPVASQETPPVPKKVKLMEGTEVALRMGEDISSRTAKPGQPVELALAEDLKVGDITVAKAGARALGEVVQAKRPDFWGEAGEVSIRVHFLRVGDNKVAIRGAAGTAGKRYIIIRGSQGVIKAGTAVKAFVAADVEVSPVEETHATLDR